MPSSPVARSATHSPQNGAPLTGEGEPESVEWQAENGIEAGDYGEGSDAGYETDTASRNSTSLSSSVRDYAFEYGRRYHKYREGQYQFPNDEPEQAREDMKHAMILNLCGGHLHFAPLENPQQVLDMGTGTGIWCIDMGDEYPGCAEILGVDLSPIQPVWVPPNVKFLVDDLESPWLHKLDHYDYIHGRHLSVAIKDMPKMLSEAYKCTKPGGWLELQEMLMKSHCDDSTMPENYGVTQWLDHMKQALDVFGPDLHGARHHADYLREAGFVNIQTRVFKIPIGTWPKDKTLKTVGLYGSSMIYDGLESNSMKAFTKGLGWTVEQVHVFLVGVRKDLQDPMVHCYLPFHITFGQKPLH